MSKTQTPPLHTLSFHGSKCHFFQAVVLQCELLQSPFFKANLLQTQQCQAHCRQTCMQGIGGAEPCVFCSLRGTGEPSLDCGPNTSESLSDVGTAKICKLLAACNHCDPKHPVAVPVICYLTRSRLGHSCPGCLLRLGPAQHQAQRDEQGPWRGMDTSWQHRPFFHPCTYSVLFQNSSWGLSLKWTTRTFSKGNKYHFLLRVYHLGIQKFLQTQKCD